MTNAGKDALNNFASKFLLAEVLAEKSHQALVKEIADDKKANCCYGCKTNSSVGCYRNKRESDQQWLSAIGA